MPEKAARLAFQLPRDSRVFRRVHPGNTWGWTESILNRAANLLDVIVWQTSNIGVKKAKQTKKPEPFMPEFARERSPINKEVVSHTTEDIRNILALPRG